MRDRQDLILRIAISAVIATVGLAAGAVSANMQNPLRHPIGPGYVPLVVSVCLVALSVWVAIGATRDIRVEPADPVRHAHADGVALDGDQHLRLIGAAIVLGFSLLVWRVGGYLPGIVTAMFGLLIIDRKVRPRAGLLFAAVAGLLLWLLFSVVLGIDLG